MKEDVKKAWLEALRSGRYTQTKQFLRNDDAFCCMGVLCDVLDPKVWSDNYWCERGSVPMGTRLNYKTLEHHGISEDTQDLLMAMNDEGYSFEEIADVIEEKV